MRARELSGSWVTVLSASAIAASSALRLLHTTYSRRDHVLEALNQAPLSRRTVAAFAYILYIRIYRAITVWVEGDRFECSRLAFVWGSALFVSPLTGSGRRRLSSWSFRGRSPWNRTSGSTGRPFLYLKFQHSRI